MTATTYTDRGELETPLPSRTPITAETVRTGIRVIVAGAAVVLIGAGWPLHVGATLLFGVAVLLYALASMAREAPVDRG